MAEPPEWLAKEMHVRGVPTPLGPVDWNWTPGSLRVRLPGARCPVRTGPTFPADAIEMVDR